MMPRWGEGRRRQGEAGMGAIDELIDKYVDLDQDNPEAGFIDDLESWYDGCFEPASEPSADDFRMWYSRLTEQTGGQSHGAAQIDIKAMFGQLARQLDWRELQLSDDAIGVPSTSARHTLIQCGLAPTGLWLAELLLDRCEALAGTESRTIAVEDEQLTDGGPPGSFVDDYAELLRDANELAAASSSVPARRCCAAVASWCSHRLGEHNESIEHADRYFELEQQAQRESEAQPYQAELELLAVAAVGSAALLEDRAAVDEVMRRVRLLVESDGRLRPVFASVWAHGLAELDPEYAQMIAQRLVLDIEEVGLRNEDIGFWSSFLLFEMTVASGDHDAAAALAAEWVPLAMAADHGPGVQRWLEIVQVEGDDES